MPKLLLSAESFCVTYAHVLSFMAWPSMHHWFGFSPVSAAHTHSQARYMPSPAMTALVEPWARSTQAPLWLSRYRQHCWVWAFPTTPDRVSSCTRQRQAAGPGNLVTWAGGRVWQVQNATGCQCSCLRSEADFQVETLLRSLHAIVHFQTVEMIILANFGHVYSYFSGWGFTSLFIWP